MATFAEKAKQKFFTRSATEESPLHHQSPSDGVFSTKKSKKSEPVSQASGEGSSPPGTDAGGGTGAKRRANSLKALLRNPFNRSSRSSDSESSQSRLSGQSLPSPPTSPGTEMGGQKQEKNKARHHSSPTPGTFEYIVKEGDKLRSLAAQFDTTPSVLKKLNRLTMDFLYPGQVLWIPNEDYVALNTKPSPTTQPTNIVKESSESPTKKEGLRFPGHVIRKDHSCHSIVDESELPPRPLSTNEAEYLDQECFERFIKINSYYITEHHGTIDGVLLVTPNAVMFDPNVSNPLVIEKGAEEFGMIAKMDTIMSAAIYHDLEAMDRLQQRKNDPTIAKPKVYHSKDSGNDTTTAEKLDEDSGVNGETQDDSCQCDKNQSEKDTSPPVGFSIGESSTPSMILNVSSLTDMMELSLSTKSDTSKQVAPADSKLADPPSEHLRSEVSHHQDNLLIDIGSSEGGKEEMENNNVDLPEPSTDQLKQEVPSESITQSATEDSGEEHSLPNHASDLQALPSPEFSLVEYDLVNTAHSVGNSKFYSVLDGVPDIDFPDVVFQQGSRTSRQRKKMNSNNSSSTSLTSPRIELKAAVSVDDKPQLFQSLNDMIPNGLVTENLQQSADEPSLYLCLKIGQPINKSVSANCPIESYSKKKRPEYWFSIPREKVDKLYAFFIQWKSEVYDSDDRLAAEIGFVALKDENEAGVTKEEPLSGESPRVRNQLGRQFTLDWEIVSVEEIRRRKELLDIEKYIPLPELMEPSSILLDIHIKQLVKCMPARVEGYPWSLGFGSESHGFSLKQLYRNLQNIDSPVLLVILTTNDEIFGAMSSCPFHMSDLFYGTGESFLFTFVDGFKTYPWSGQNNFFNKGDHSCLSIGAGEGSYGIWIDGDIYIGRTQNCQTYANDPLTGGEEDFHIKHIEVWCFHDD